MSKKQFDLITVGGATIDISFYSKEGELISTGNAIKQKLLAFEYGAKIVADRVFNTFGGGCSNAAVSAARLGLKTAALCRIGKDDFGKRVLANLTANKVDSGLVGLDSKNPTAFTVILTVDNPSKEHIAFVYRGANAVLNDKDILLSSVNAKWFYVTSLPAVGWQKIMDKLVATGKKIAWNPGNEQLKDIPAIKRYLNKIEVLIVNHDEALEFKKLKDIKGLLAHLKSLGPKVAVITDGANGAYAVDGKKQYFMKARSSKPVNTLGVGDAFGSTLTSALVYDKNIKEALTWGIKNSASVVNHIGAQTGLLTKKEIEK
ncbi:MAG: carbohydrate kinase family protein [Patescibacteria group bacterium]|jgi:sugar/nucleoside kinase (ribokinase family)